MPFKFKKAAVLQNQARFNPLQYVIHLADDASTKGCLIFENTRVVKISENKLCKLMTENGHQIIAKKIIMATHTPIGVNTTQLFTAPYRSYVVSAYLNNNDYPEGHLWDLDCPHHATCTHAISGENPDILMVAGSPHKVGQDKNTFSNYKALEKFLSEHFSIKEFAYRWSAQHYQSADDVPYIGLASRFAKHTYMATGYFADGLIYGTIAGLLIGDMITLKKNVWTKVYHANRFPVLASASFLAKEDTNYFLQYYKDFPKKPVKSFNDMKVDDARVVDIEREKWGVYKDKDGKLHIVSAVCSHMKCIVDWNNAEKTWDCPCHGSRFSIDGEVIEGPAKTNLKKKEI
jgi:nitrite reductase/ring-hydroxylating ferredoxin subunit